MAPSSRPSQIPSTGELNLWTLLIPQLCTFVLFVSLRYPSELADRLRAKLTDKASAAKRVKFGDNYEDADDAGLLSEQALLDIGDANDGKIH